MPVEIQTKEFRMVTKTIDEKAQTLEVVANSGQLDRGGEILPALALKFEDYLANPVVLWAHDYSSLPIGKTLSLRIEGDALIAVIKFAETAFAQDVWKLYQGGFLNAVSVGFIGRLREGGQDGTPVKWTEAVLIDISAVPIPQDAKALARRLKILGVDERKSLHLLLETVADDADWANDIVAKAGHVISQKNRTLIEEIIASLTQLLGNTEEVEAKSGAKTLEVVTKVEETEETIRIPIMEEEGKHDGHRIRTITISAEEGIQALYCGDDKVVITYLFDKAKGWTLGKAKKWVADHATEAKSGSDNADEIAIALAELTKALTEV